MMIYDTLPIQYYKASFVVREDIIILQSNYKVG